MLCYSQCLELVDNEGQSDVTIPVRLGDTIPGYVAATKLPISINLLKQVISCLTTQKRQFLEMFCALIES